MNQDDKNEAAVSDTLRHAVDQLEVPTTGLTAIRERGTARRQRARATVATCCAAVLVGGGMLAVQRLSATPDRTTVPGVVPTDSSGDALPVGTALPVVTALPQDSVSGIPVVRVDPAFVWNVVTPGSAEALGSLVYPMGATDVAPYFAWSSSPGVNTDGLYQPMLYRSDDAIHWAPSTGGTFTEPDVSRLGLAAQGDTLFAFGTSAAIAAIPKHGAGDAVVDISTDGGASWQHQVLPIDLRGLATTDGVNSVSLSGAIAAANGVVVVVAQPGVFWDAQNEDNNLAITAQGAYSITYPTSDEYVIDDTQSIQSDLIPLSDLNIDPASVEAARTPRAFFSTDGATFTEATLPPLPAEVMPSGGNEMRVFTAGGQFYATFYVSIFDPSLPYGYDYGQLVYRSADGATWEQVGDPASFKDKELVGVLPDGTIVARSNTATGVSAISTSVDGVTWVVHDLSPLIDASDGKIVGIDLWVVAVGSQGITAIGNAMNDPIAEEGGRSLERDGVRLEVQSGWSGQLRAYDIETGEQFPDQNLRYLNLGGLEVLADDGSALASFTATEWQALTNITTEAFLRTPVLVHSDDGVSWSRENLADITGSAWATPGFFQQHDDKVLINLFDSAQRVDDLATTLVLVGTRQ